MRFNRSAIRQAGTVVQRFLAPRPHPRQTTRSGGASALSGDLDSDRARLTTLAHRTAGASCRISPRIRIFSMPPRCTPACIRGKIVCPERAMPWRPSWKLGDGRDLVGIYAAGGIYAGFANALGQRNWFSSFTFNCDWSFYHAAR